MLTYSQLLRLLEEINKTIKIAIDHGGDDGGPYFSESTELNIQLHKFVEFLVTCYSFRICVEDNNYPRLVTKIKIEDMKIDGQDIDYKDFIEDKQIKDATILTCGKYGITSEEYYKIAEYVRSINE